MKKKKPKRKKTRPVELYQAHSPYLKKRVVEPEEKKDRPRKKKWDIEDI